MSSKEVFEKAYGNVPKEIPTPFEFDWIPSYRGFKFYYIKVKRFFTR
jgi:hypothetical protein